MSKRSREYIKEKTGKHVSTILGGSVCLHSIVRCADLPELYQVQMDFAGKYVKEFEAAAPELMPEHGVSRQGVRQVIKAEPENCHNQLKSHRFSTEGCKTSSCKDAVSIRPFQLNQEASKIEYKSIEGVP
ncbi:hypothetical protein Tco_1023057 [Tanacetum coccineum]